MKPKYPKKPGKLYSIATIIVRTYVKLFWNIEIHRNFDEKIKPPFIVLSNHQSNIDFILATISMFPYKMNYVVGKYQFRNPLTGFIFRLGGAIPKEQFYPDINTVREMQRVIKQNGVPAVFPSGQSSYTGECTIIPGGIEKLLKMCKCPVLNLHIEGAHIAFPKWNMPNFYNTPIKVTVSDLLSADDIKNETPENIYNKILGALYFNDFVLQKEKMYKTRKSRNTKGLEYILYKCPKCNTEFLMESINNQLVCKKCDNSATIDDFGFLQKSGVDDIIFENTKDWNDWQVTNIKKDMTQNQSYQFNEEAEILKCGKNGGFKKDGSGSLLWKSGFVTFTGKNKKGKQIDIKINASNLPTFQHEVQNGIDMVNNNDVYRFIFKNKGAAFKLASIQQIFSK